MWVCPAQAAFAMPPGCSCNLYSGILHERFGSGLQTPPEHGGQKTQLVF